MRAFLLFLSDFVFLYPLLMSFMWMVGGVIFYWRHERGQYKPPDLEEYPLFSIMIPAHNESHQITNTVNELLHIDYPNYEIIIVDDGSTDGTAAIAVVVTVVTATATPSCLGVTGGQHTA